MSLYVGHLSPQTRREDLERVFRRFGRCTVQLKDGYGFVVYEVTANAERALRSMRGKIVCGEQITLSWSNKQPRAFSKFSRSARVHESLCGRDFKDGRRFSVSVNREAQRTEDELERAHETFDGSHGTEEIRAERETSFKEQVHEHGGGEQDPVENGRWGEEFADVVNEQGIDNGADFDRYVPYHGHRGRNISSSDREISTEKVDINHDKSKAQPTCYRCGLVGHIKRNCPEGSSRRGQFGKNFHKRDDIHSRARTDGRLKRPISRDRREPGKFRRANLSSESPPERNVKQRKKLRKESEKRRQKQKDGNTVRRQKKKRARSGISSLLSNSSTASSHSRLRASRSRSRARSRSGSRSLSSRPNLVSSSSESATIRSSSKSTGSRSRSSSPLSRSLSVSLDRKLPTAPEKALVNDHGYGSSNGVLEHVANEPTKLLVANLDTAEPEDVPGDQDASFPMEVDDGTGDERQLVGDDGTEGSLCQIRGKETRLCRVDGVSVVPSRLDLPIESSSSKSSSSNMTTQEVIMVMTHYGLSSPTDVDQDMSVEEYFGAARLWPWEIIYYRRLKKGPITIENYARRVEQNKEFGIVDKFIRSSSGWES